MTGINPGDVVANSGFDKLQDNAKVAVDNSSNQQGNISGNGNGNGSPGESGKKNRSNSP